MNDDDRPTNPDPRSPYEHILDELTDIKGLLQGPGGITPRVARLELLVWLPVAITLLLAACELVK